MYQHFATWYDQIFPVNPEVFKQFIPWMLNHRKAVDLGCATGHVVHLMHQQGMDATGVDLDRAMIDVAKSNYPSLSYIAMDMVDYLSTQKDIYLITCLGNTIPHLNHEQIHRFFEHASKALAKDGTMIIQWLNYDKILSELPDHLPTIKRDNLSFLRHYHYVQDHIIFETKLMIGHLETQGSTHLYPYLKDEFIKIIQQHGLKASYYQNLKLEPWSISGSHQTWLVTH